MALESTYPTSLRFDFMKWVSLHIDDLNDMQLDDHEEWHETEANEEEWWEWDSEE